MSPMIPRPLHRTPHRARPPRLLAALALCTGLWLGLPAPQAQASEVGQSKKFGLGAYLGQPTGLTMKYFFTPQHALSGALGLGWWAGHNFHIHVDYNYHFKLKSTGDFDFLLWLGGGLKLFFFYYGDYHPYWDKNWRDHDYGRVGVGVRLPIGIAFHLNRVPLDVFLEIVPGFAFLPWLDFFADGGIGVRYYF